MRDERHAAAGRELPVHFFTIVLNGEPFIRYHLPVLRSLPFRWHWHVVEGVASLAHDTGWSLASGGRVPEDMHKNGLSIDGTSEYLDELAVTEPDRVTLYRRPGGRWDGKREMVSAPLENVREECLLWQLDSDELWTTAQIVAVRDAFLDNPERTAAYYWCDYFVGPRSIITTRWNYAQNPAVEWLRTWRYLPGDSWAAHEPPTLVRQGSGIDVGRTRPFLHDETEQFGAVFQHFAYATEEQVRFKERYYGYAGALAAWRGLQAALGAGRSVRLADYLPWVTDDTLVDDADRELVQPLAVLDADGWRFLTPGDEPERPAGPPPAERPIVVDGVFFQDFSTTGIARVWRSLLDEWLRSGFADRIVFLERAGHGPRIPGVRTRSLPRWVPERSAEDSFRLQRICDELDAALFVSTYYTTPVATPTAMVVYDLIPERLQLDMSDPIWDSKREAIEHASSYLCISENTCRDLVELYPAAAGRPAATVHLGIDPRFAPASAAEIDGFREKHNIRGPYVLLVGDRRGVDGYKNGGVVFRAFDLWSGKGGAEIVCVGGHPEIEPEYRRAAPAAQIHRLALDDAELRLAYSGALCLAYPSRYEGFGLPVAEAMACGCPVITTRVSSIPEVAGDAAIYVAPDDERELARAFDLVNEPEQRAALVEAGLERVRRFRWPAAARVYADGLADAADRDTASERAAREAHWLPIRERQVREQALLRPAGPPPPPRPEPVATPSLVSRIESFAVERLPPREIVRLRTLKAWLRRANAGGRRRVRTLRSSRHYGAMRTIRRLAAGAAPTLDDGIPPEIVGGAFSKAIEDVASDPRVREILEIGSSSGSGSTEAWVRGALRNPSRPRLHCIEVSTERYAALVERWRNHPFVRCYNLSSVPVEAFPSPEEVREFYEETPSKLRAFDLQEILGWLQQDVDYVAGHGLSAPGIERIKEANNLETFDAVLIDGSEFTGSPELDAVYGARFLLLDDTENFKNWRNARRLAADPRYRLVTSDPKSRNGFAVFERVD